MAWAGDLLDSVAPYVSITGEIVPSYGLADRQGRWNSAVFTSRPFVAFPVAGVTNDFLQVSDDWASQRPILDPEIAHNSSAIYALHEHARNFTRMSNLECMETYIDPRKPSSELVLVANITAAQNNESSLVFGWISGSNSARWDSATFWICRHRGAKHDRFCNMNWAREFQDEWTVGQDFYTPDGERHSAVITVEYCLIGEQSNKMPERCESLYNKFLLFVICTLTLLDSGLILAVLVLHQKHTLVQVGDAITEALDNPSSHHQPDTNVLASRRRYVILMRKRWSPQARPRWHKAITRRAWIISITL